MGQVIAPLISGFAELIARCVFAFVFGSYFGFFGICTATPAAWITGAVVLFLCYKISLLKIRKYNLSYKVFTTKYIFIL